MTHAIAIPPEVVEAGRRAFANAGTADDDRDPIAEACLAMLNAWPGMWVEQLYPLPVDTQGIILPLPQEARDE